jgi:hypothetical protein
MYPSFWINASPRRKRIISIIITFIILLAITTAGTLAVINEQDANQTNDEMNQEVNTLKDKGLLLQFIFGNNFMISLIMFVPFVGPLFGAYVLYNTGAVIAAIATAQDFPSTLSFFALFLTPIAWLEYLAYSIGIAESVWLIRRILQHGGKHELVNASKFISICAVLLFVSAAIETMLIYAGS